jgi:hypothetical protein
MKRKWTTTDLVAMVLSISIGVALNVFIIMAGLEAWFGPFALPIGLSDNATQILGSWGGGIISVIGALVGVRIGQKIPSKDAENADTSSSH